MTRLGHASPVPFSCGDLTLEGDLAPMGLGPGLGAGPILALVLVWSQGEAVQIEAQALVLERVIRDTSNTRLPATAWPRQALAAYTARHVRGHGGVVDGWLLALVLGSPHGGVVDGWLLALVLGSHQGEGWSVV